MTINNDQFVSSNMIEIINPDLELGQIKSAIFDFDGTISLIREGWQGIMIPMMVNLLLKTPNHEEKSDLENIVEDFVALSTGKQTIYQMIRLADEISKRGSIPKDPLEYKNQYHDLLMQRIKSRISGLKEGSITPEQLAVPGAISFVEELSSLGIVCFLASGTDEKYVIEEAELLGVSKYFKAIYGAQDDYQNFSKKMVIERIQKENNLYGPELIAFGDGYVEIENTKDVNGIAVGIASNEAKRQGIDEWKRKRLIASGADLILPDFRESKIIIDYLLRSGQDAI